MQSEKQANRLIDAHSPYLLQHAYNPVDWYEWGEEAFAEAKKQNKPIFLSIGYSACHWCHVMEHESFNNAEIAGLMNETFINIKVDREERPDIDAVYMAAAQAMNKQGGWPLSIVMTPEKQPFFAATYIPPEQRYNRFGMREFVPKIQELWETRNDEIVESANAITKALTEEATDTGSKKTITNEIFRRAFLQFSERYDAQLGGFGNAPKFPSPHNIIFLLRYWFYSGDTDALNMAVTTLKAMRLGGMYDQIGFGFHRYSTDRQWLLPHFEKMLYDQAMLLYAYTEAYRATGNPLFSETALEIVRYLSERMISDEGLFYSAEDADSEGEEGKYYLWHSAEIDELLGEDSELLKEYWNISTEGNFVDPIKSAGKTGENIPHLTLTLEDFARNKGIVAGEFAEKVKSAGFKLMEARNKRIPPFKDDKILTDWNGLMIGALAYAGFVLREPSVTGIARRAFAAINELCLSDTGALFHRKRGNEVGITGMLDDYAGIIFAAIELFSATGNSSYLSKALTLTEYTINAFKDTALGGFFQTPMDAEQLIVRSKEKYDGAIPSGNSLMLFNLSRLAKMTGSEHLQHEEKILAAALSATVHQYPSVYTFALCGFMYSLYPGKELVLALSGNYNTDTDFINVLADSYHPGTVHILKSSHDAILDAFVPFSKPMEAEAGKPAAYLCNNYTCGLPIDTPEMLRKALEEK